MSPDGACDSKHTFETVQEHRVISKPEPKPTKLRRFMSIGSRKSTSSSRDDMSTKPSNTPPLQTLSPRPTELELHAKKHAKRSISTFLLTRTSAAELESAKHNNDTSAARNHLPVTETASLALPAAAVRQDGEDLGGQGHVPVAGKPHQTQLRKDSVTKSFYDLPLSASRTAALTSHPVSKEDLDSEEFQTPSEFGGPQLGDHVEK